MELEDIVQEIRQFRDAYAERFGYDLEAIYRDLKEKEKASGRKVVRFPPRRPQRPGDKVPAQSQPT